MSKQTNTKPFYNSTIPSDWEVKKFREIVVEGKLGGNYENAEANNGIPVIKMGNLDRGVIKIDKVQYLPENENYNKEDVLEEGDLLFNTRNTLELVGKVAIWKNELPFAVYNSNLMRMKFDRKFVESNWFMNYAFNSYQSLSQLRGIATGTTSVAAIYGRDLETIKFALPSRPEQKAIAHILSLMDTAINKNNLLIAKKELQKKWLMQNLLTGKKRLTGFEKEKWKMKLLEDVLIPVRKPLLPKQNELYQQIGIRSHTKGLFYKEKVTGTTLGDKRVFWVEPNCFIVNIVFAWEQAIAKTTQKEVGMIASHRFPMFKSKGDILDIDYLLNYFKSTRGKHLLGLASPGGAGRNKTLGQSELMSLQIPVPTLKEQTVISQVLQAADKEIQLLKAKTEKLREQKKGMMQVLLTGKKRVKI